MVTELATRFAETSLRLYGHECTFDIALDSGMDIESVTRAFEALGCHVDRHPTRRQLTIVCPQPRVPAASNT